MMLVKKIDQWLERPLKIFILIVVLAFGIYANSLNNAFHYDDSPTIVENPAIRSLANIPHFFLSKQDFSSDETFAAPKHYRPVLLTTYAFNYALGGLNPLIYHLTNIVLHSLTAFFIYLLVLLLMENRIAALLSGLLFAVHPLHTEAVNYISARSSILATLFYLLAFYYFLRYRFGPSQQVSLGLFYLFALLGVLTKEIVITLPLMMAAYDLLVYTSVRAKGQRLGSLFWPYIPMAAALVFYLALAHAQLYHILRTYLVGGGGLRDPWIHLLTQAKVTVQYLGLFLWPAVLTPDWRVSAPRGIGDGAVLFSLGVIFILLLVAVRLARARSSINNTISLGIFWFFITSLPVILVPLNLQMQEHRAYLPAVGLTLSAGVMVRFLQVLGERSRTPWRILSPVGTLLLLIVMIWFGFLVIKRNAVWKDDLSLWLDAASKPVSGFRAHLNLGTAYEKRGLLNEALQAYQKSLEMEPQFFVTHYNLGLVYHKLGQEDTAIPYYLESLRVNPWYPLTHHWLGIAYATVGQLSLAQSEIEKALSLDPSLLLSRSALGWLHLTQNHPDQAKPYFLEVLSSQPDSVRDRLGLATVYNHRHEFPQAIEEYEKVIQLEPRHVEAHYTLALIYDELGQTEKAIYHYRITLNIAIRSDRDKVIADLANRRLRSLEQGS